MSFLNPVNEAVLRFKSTDAGAPQINYAARTAGDIKAVLKACLVTGYGAKASAGWSIANEVDHVAEFVSPIVAISDYRVGINDSSAANTSWYYYFQDNKVNPPASTVTKSPSSIRYPDSRNEWQFIVTNRGFWFIEIFSSSFFASTIICRATYFGAIKSAVNNTVNNISFWTIGYASPSNTSLTQLIENLSPDKRVQNIGNYNNVLMDSVINVTYRLSHWGTNNELAVVTPLYMYSGGVFLGEHSGMYLRLPVKGEDFMNCFDTTIDGRPMLQLCITNVVYSSDEIRSAARVVLIPLDVWDY